MSDPGRRCDPPPVRRLVRWLDGAAEPLLRRTRGVPAVDDAALALSAASDHGIVWVAIAAAKACRGTPRRPARALLVAGVTSYGVNAAVKAAVGRRRPVPSAPTPRRRALRVRPPSSSSFPSGHTLAACCAAVALPDSRREAAAFGGLALAVAASRLHLEAHHGSDVAGAMVIGTAAGVVARRLREPRRRATR